jgi:hypothetical protein
MLSMCGGAGRVGGAAGATACCRRRAAVVVAAVTHQGPEMMRLWPLSSLLGRNIACK